ncbi:hypothetical protein OIU85_029890 [Salix viminalis]|uniref:Uncharacterized protein n=1 Tax=Salix viminalis TaxID=40686 RepID=A0A9Q0QCC1_SALVM|nr:hypothetical protein OIU85_029889 [Salix viminalis]KAJ6704007.1 hypothetical protein OIU85_029890 [Salix viminalis]
MFFCFCVRNTICILLMAWGTISVPTMIYLTICHRAQLQGSFYCSFMSVRTTKCCKTEKINDVVGFKGAAFLFQKTRTNFMIAEAQYGVEMNGIPLRKINQELT